MKDFSVKLTETIEDRLQTFKRQIMEDNSSSLESAMKKVKKVSYAIKGEGNKKQYEHQEKLAHRSVC